MRRHFGFEIDVKTVRDPVDVVEVRDHLDGVVDGAIVEAMTSQNIKVGFADAAGRLGQLDGIVAKSAVGRGEVGGRVINFDGLDEGVVLDLGPEVLRVGERSVMAIVDAGDNGGNEFAVKAAQGRRFVHDVNI
jgi:hypothetical protein